VRLLVVCDDPPLPGLPSSAGHTHILEQVLPAWRRRGVDVRVLTFGRAAAAAGLTVLPLEPSRVRALRAPRVVAERSGPGARRAVGAASAEVDVTLVHGHGCFGLVDAVRSPLVANEIDPMSLFWTDQVPGLAAAAALAGRVRAARLRRGEVRAARVAAAYLVVDTRDATDLGSALGREVVAVPLGVSPVATLAAVLPDGLLGRPVLSMTGSLDHAPNIASARELVTEVLPRVRRVVPGAAVVLAGRRPAAEVLALAGPDVVVLADVPSTAGVHAAASVAVFPGGWGRGSRNSVREALMTGTPVVASAASARGLVPGPGLQVAAGADALAAAVVALLADEGLLAAASRSAADLGAALPSWEQVADLYLALLSDVAALGPAG